MNARWYEKIMGMIFLIIAFPVFEYVVQPVLVYIHPTFRDRNIPADQMEGFLPQTPAGWTFLGTGFLLIIIYYMFIKPSYERSNESV